MALAWNSELPAGLDAALAESHLRACPQCAADLELARISRGLEEDPRIAIFPGPRVKDDTARTSAGRGWRTAAIAAGLAGVIATSGWLNSAGRIRSLQEQIATNTPPPAAAAVPLVVPDIPFEELKDVVRGGEEAVEVPAGVRVYMLTLPAEHEEIHQEHRLTVTDASGAAVGEPVAIERNVETSDYIFSLAPQGRLKPGLYTVTVAGREGERWVATETSSFRIVP